MDDVIAAKFNPPVWMGDQIRRDKLLGRLDLALSQRMTLVHAPAGYGKTSILAQWRLSLEARPLEDRPHKISWVSLDRDDSDLKRFVRQLIFAIRGDEPDADDHSLAADLPPRAALSAILNMLSGESRPFILILDDCHNADSSSVLEFLQKLVKNAPGNCHFVFASRDFPWLGQSVLAAEEQFLEISSEDLRFSRQEAELLLSRVKKALEPGEVTRILERTEGWPIAVQLISLSLKGGVAHDQIIEQFGKSGTDLARYLSEQVLMGLPEETRDVVIRSALLDKLTGELVDLLCDRDDGWLLLERLEQQGVFLIPTSPDRRQYRYHQLFAEYLRDHFQRSDSALFVSLQRRAAEWFAEQGMVADAVNHAILSEDSAMLAKILEDAGGWRLIPQGLQGVVEEGLARLPEELIRSRPRLALAQVYLQLKLGELGKARAEFDRFLESSRKSTFSADLRTEIRVVGDTLADYENQPVTLEDLLAREALLRKLPANDHLVFANISETIAAKYFEGGWLERALQPALVARDHYRAFGSIYSDIFTRFLEARIKRAQGRSKEAAGILKSARDTIVENFGDTSDLVANCSAFQAEILYEQDHVGEACEMLDWALPHMEQSDGWVDVYAAAYFTEARALAGEGMFEDAVAVIDRARRTASWRRLRQLELLANICEVDLHVINEPRSGNGRELAGEIGLDQLAATMAEESPIYRPVAVAASLCEARLRLLGGEIERAMHRLAGLHEWAGQRGAGRLLIDINILSAYGHRSTGAVEEARACFDEAVGIAMFQDIVRPFLEMRQFVHPFINDALAGDIHVDRFRGQFLKGLAKSLSASKNRVTVNGPFTEAETEVLYYLSQGFSNKEIARFIGMSPDTVKYRLKSMFKKIGVHKRADAVRVSAERGLIPNSVGSTAPECFTP